MMDPSSRRAKLDVNLDNLSGNPQCPHGPTVLFHRTFQKPGAASLKNSFYACSAYRDKKDCKFYLPYPQKKQFKKRNEEVNSGKSSRRPVHVHDSVTRWLGDLSQRNFCRRCSRLMHDENEAATHRHKDLDNVDARYPTRFLPPRCKNESEAQYFFSEKTTRFFLQLIKSLKVSAVLNIGCPRLHEEIAALLGEAPKLKTFLLDIDSRFGDYFPAEDFAQYNMFNHHFFDSRGQKQYLNFITSNPAQDLLIVMDPPFGGMVEVLAHGLHAVLDDVGTECRILWVFPYFMQKLLSEQFPGFEMISYKVEYENHRKFKDTMPPPPQKTRVRGSPIRIFTNMRPDLVHLPKDEGYWYCEQCCRYSAAEAKHCFDCEACPSNDGKTWKHCRQCGYCVKGDWKHCDGCQKCHSKICLQASGGGS